MADKILRTYGDKSRKPSFRKGKAPKKVIYPKWWSSKKK